MISLVTVRLMVALIQRVTSASVRVDGIIKGEIRVGLLVLLGVHRDDSEEEAEWLAGKVTRLRVFPDQYGKMNRSLVDIGGELLVVSQFTLYGDASKGNRPSFVNSAPAEKAEALYESFVRFARECVGERVETGDFGAMMDVALVNDGPVTLWLERSPTAR